MVFRNLSFDLHLHHGELKKLPVIFFGVRSLDIINPGDRDRHSGRKHILPASIDKSPFTAGETNGNAPGKKIDRDGPNNLIT